MEKLYLYQQGQLGSTRVNLKDDGPMQKVSTISNKRAVCVNNNKDNFPFQFRLVGDFKV